MVVLAGWVVLSLPAAMLLGTLFGHQRRFLPEGGGAAAVPRVPVQAGLAA